MPVINFRYDDFITLVGTAIDKKEFEEKAPLLGISIEKLENNEVSIEVFPNRPDLKIPPPQYIFSPGDRILVIGNREDIKRLQKY